MRNKELVVLLVILFLFSFNTIGEEDWFGYEILLTCDTNIFSDCEIIQGNIKNYSIHGDLEELQSISFTYTGDQIKCYDKTAVDIAYYDENISEWVFLGGIVTQQEGTENYIITAETDYLGYMTMVKSEGCVASGCGFGAYFFSNFGGVAGVSDRLGINFCGIVPKCNANADDICDVNCVQGIDPDCGVCSSGIDCCFPSKDDICDLDCYDNVDPDC